jgi:hypothetical protein
LQIKWDYKIIPWKRALGKGEVVDGLLPSNRCIQQFYTYRNLALQVGGGSKLEGINYVHEPRGTQIYERLRWLCPAKNQNY